MKKKNKMRSIVVLFMSILLSCNNEVIDEIGGTWMVMELKRNGNLIIPDTSSKLMYYPSMHFFKDGLFVVPTTYKQRYLTGKYRIRNLEGESYINIYESPDSVMMGLFKYRTFKDSTAYSINRYIEIYDSTFYLLAQKTANTWKLR